jgi:hypothetical protein
MTSSCKGAFFHAYVRACVRACVRAQYKNETDSNLEPARAMQMHAQLLAGQHRHIVFQHN